MAKKTVEKKGGQDCPDKKPTQVVNADAIGARRFPFIPGGMAYPTKVGSEGEGQKSGSSK